MFNKCSDGILQQTSLINLEIIVASILNVIASQVK